jgi:hypothetical protein
MDLNLGGPVWHASAASHWTATGRVLERDGLRKRAMQALDGVGAKELGQWEEWTGRAFHVRRRLSAEEEKITGPIKDIRGTKEALERVERVLAAAPFLKRDAVFEEAGLKVLD